MVSKTKISNILVFIFFIILFSIGIIGGVYYDGIDFFAYYFSLPFYLIAEKTTPFINIPIYAAFLFVILKKRDTTIYKINLLLLATNVIAYLFTIVIANLWGLAITKIFVGN